MEEQRSSGLERRLSDYAFVEPDAQQRLRSTRSVLINRRLFCGRCHQQALNQQRPIPDCPQCRAVNELNIKCMYEASGCSWSGSVAELNEHEAGCPKRPFQCDFCHNFSSTFEDVQLHIEECEYRTYKCVNECGAMIAQNQLNYHLKYLCPLSSVSCDFAYAGCEAPKMLRRELERHLESNEGKHLSLMCSLNRRLKDQVGHLDEENFSLKDRVLGLEQQVAWACQEIAAVKDRFATMPSAHTHSNYEMGTQAKSNGRLRAASVSENKVTSHVPVEFRSIQSSSVVASSDNESLNTLQEIQELKKEVTRLKEQTELTKQVCSAMEPRVLSVTPYTITIPNFGKYRKSNSRYCCPPFYSQTGGYQLRLVVYPNGKGAENKSFVSVFVQVLEGDYDGNLDFPFQAQITLHISKNRGGFSPKMIAFNDVTPQDCCLPTTESGKDGWGEPKLITPEELSQYLCDGALIIRVFRVYLDVNNWIPLFPENN